MEDNVENNGVGMIEGTVVCGTYIVMQSGIQVSVNDKTETFVCTVVRGEFTAAWKLQLMEIIQKYIWVSACW